MVHLIFCCFVEKCKRQMPEQRGCLLRIVLDNDILIKIFVMKTVLVVGKIVLNLVSKFNLVYLVIYLLN